VGATGTLPLPCELAVPGAELAVWGAELAVWGGVLAVPGAELAAPGAELADPGGSPRSTRHGSSTSSMRCRVATISARACLQGNGAHDRPVGETTRLANFRMGYPMP
jgi:hypothetical protein